MFKTENAHLGPNILAQTIEEADHEARSKPRPFRDATNSRSSPCHLDKFSKGNGNQPNLQHFTNVNQATDLKLNAQPEKENQVTKDTRIKNLLINFDSEDDSADEEETIEQNVAAQTAKQSLTQPTKTAQRETSSRKNCLLLAIDSDDEEIEEQNSKQQGRQDKNEEEPPASGNQPVASQKQKPPAKNEEAKTQGSNQFYKISKAAKKQQFLLALQCSEEQQLFQKAQQIQSTCQKKVASNKRMVIRLASLQTRFSSTYYLQRIPIGAVFECVIKRDRCESLIKYHLYDCKTLRNFMTVIKDEDGYLIVAKELQKISNLVQQKELVIGRLVSNFFGTEFNCHLDNTPYSRGYRQAVKEDAEKAITINYQTNIFGLKGPRKIAAYIATEGEKKCQNLKNVYERQLKKKVKPTVLRFKNKTPKWCQEVNAYALNFGGRASVSSIKNFIMIGQQEDNFASQAVLFGKFGRELFNLDVRYPFSIIQAVSLAISSFDRKLACE